MDADRLSQRFTSWRQILASLPDGNIEARINVFEDAIKDVAGYVAEGLDKVQVADELHGVAQTYGLVGLLGEDDVQARIARGFENMAPDLSADWGEPQGEQEAPRGEPRQGNGQTREPPITPLRCVNIGAWETTPEPWRDWVVENRIPTKAVSLLSGHGSIGKTTIAGQLAVGTILGSDWLGAVIPTPGPVVFFTAELSEDDMRMQLKPILAHRGLAFCDIKSSLHLHCCQGQDATLGRPDRNRIIQPTRRLKELEMLVRNVKPRLIILEALTDIYAGNEIDRHEVNEFVKMLMLPLALACAGGLLMIGHTSQSGLASGSGDSGTTQWHNAVRARVIMKTTKSKDDDEPDADVREVEFKKNNWGRLDDSVRVRWKNGVFVPESESLAANPLDRVAVDQEAERVFLLLLDRFRQQGRLISPNKTSTNNAQASFADEPEALALAGGVRRRKKILAEAADRLFRSQKIHVGLSGVGPVSKQSMCVKIGPKPPEASLDFGAP
jgi:RecA-family ATPase